MNFIGGAPAARAATVASPGPTRRRNSRLGLALAGAALAVLAALGWMWLDRAVEADVAILSARPFTPIVSAPGYLSAQRMAALGAPATATVETVTVAAGDTVEAGQVLVRLDGSAARTRVALAEAQKQAAEARRQSAEASFRSAESQLRLAEANHDRRAALFATGTISQADLDLSRTSVEEARLTHSTAALAVEAAEADELASAAQVQEAEVGLSGLDIVAPFGGVVVAVRAEPGELVSAGTILVELADPAHLTIEIRVDELALPGIAEGQHAQVTLMSSPDTRRSASVTSVDRRLDPETGEAQVLLTLADMPADWAIGQRADVRIDLPARADVVFIEGSGIGWDDAGAFVFVMEAGRAQRRSVTLGAMGAGSVEIESGLSAGETVVMPDRVRAGQRILGP